MCINNMYYYNTLLLMNVVNMNELCFQAIIFGGNFSKAVYVFF